MQINIPFSYFKIEFNDNYYLVQSLNDIDFFGLVESPQDWAELYRKEIEIFLRKPSNIPILTSEFLDYKNLSVQEFNFESKYFKGLSIKVPIITASVNENSLYLVKVPQYGLEYIATKPEEIENWLNQKLISFIEAKLKKNKKQIFYLLNQPKVELGEAQLTVRVQEKDELEYISECEKYFTALNLDPESIYERGDLIQEMESALENIHLGSILIEGTPGSGKSLAIQHALKSWGEKNPDYKIYTISASNFIKKIQKHHFAWQTGIIELGQKLNNKPVIIYFQDLNSFFNIGKYENYNISVGAFLAPYIQRGDIRIITEITTTERSKIEAVNPNYLNYFQQIKMPRLTDQKLDSLMHEKIEELNQREQTVILKEVSSTALRLSQRFFPYEGIPKMPVKIIQNALFYYQSKSKDKSENITLDSNKVLEAFCYQNQINPAVLNPNINDITEVTDYFRNRLFGQTKAIDFILDITNLIKTDLSRPGKPISNLLFVGSSGVGKTQLAKLLSKHLFVKKEQFIRFDMSEYSNYGDAQRLLRSEESGRFTLVSAIKRYPFSLLLFDEIEKAHEDVFDLLLQILGAGRLTDDKGKTVNFCSSLIIMTSNIGAENLFRNYINLGTQGQDDHFEQNLISQVTKHFRPEFINRIDAIIPFKPLDRDVTRKIVEKEIAELETRMGFEDNRLKLHPSKEAIDFLTDLGFNKEFGARHIQRTIRDQLLIPLSSALLETSKNYSYDVKISVRNSKLDFNIKKHDSLLQKFESIQFLGELANDLFKMFVLHFEISTSKDFLQLNNEVESEAVVDKFKAKKDLLDQMETLKNQLDFFEYQINKEMLSKNPGTMTIEALMISWEEQLHNIKGNLISLMQPEMNQQFIYLLGGNSKFLCDFYVQLAMELGLQIQVTAINKINQTNFERSKVHSDFKNIKSFKAYLSQLDDKTIFEIKCEGPLVKLLFTKEGGYHSVSVETKKIETTRVMIEDKPILDDNIFNSILNLRSTKIRRKISKRKWEDLIYKHSRNKGASSLISFLVEHLPTGLNNAVEDYFEQDKKRSKAE
jgi:ATP-dependent Clp protease ATP-binding subunit ClpA